MSLLFQKHLEEHFHDKPMTSEALGLPLNEDTTSYEDDDNSYDSSIIEEVLTVFASMMDDDEDLELQLDSFLEEYYEDLDASDIELFKAILVRLSEESGDGSGRDDDIKSLLKTLAEPMGKPVMTTANKQGSGLSPLPGEKSVQAFLKQFALVSKFPDAFGNKSFSSSAYKYFPRAQNRYGHEAEGHDGALGYNSQKSSRPLANPTINVDIKNRAFESVDAVGIGAITHYRVLNKLSSQYVTNQIRKEQADEIAAGLNHEYEQVLAENPDLIKEFERATSKPSEIPATNLQEGLNDHSKIAGYASYLSKSKPRLDSGSLIATDPVGLQAVNDFKATQKLINENRRADDQIDEMAAINARSTGRGRRR